MKAKILKAECHARGVNLVLSAQRRTLHFTYRNFAFTPEIRSQGRREPVPFTTAVLPKTFTLGR